MEDLPELPARWVEAMAKDALCEAVVDGSAPNRDRALWKQINPELYDAHLHNSASCPNLLNSFA